MNELTNEDYDKKKFETMLDAVFQDFKPTKKTKRKWVEIDRLKTAMEERKSTSVDGYYNGLMEG